MNPAIELDRLSVTFTTSAGPVTALRHMSLAVPDGGLVVMAGESGSGKSVLAHTLTGLLPANATVTGQVRLDGQPLYDLVESERRALRAQHIALIPQAAATALQPVRRLSGQLKATARYRGLDVASAESKFADRLASLGLDWAQLRDRYPHQLSGGMQQRVLTALATLADPPVVIADEPTNGLDADLVEATAELLLAIHRRGATMVVITHDLRLAARLGGDMALLHGASLVEYGETATMLREPTHPYAQGLLAALPENGGIPIPGVPVRLDRLPPGCTFVDRCPLAHDACREAPPAATPVGHGTVWCVAAESEHRVLVAAAQGATVGARGKDAAEPADTAAGPRAGERWSQL